MALSLGCHRLADAEFVGGGWSAIATQERSASDYFAPRHYFADARMSIVKVKLFRQRLKVRNDLGGLPFVSPVKLHELSIGANYRGPQRVDDLVFA